MPRRGDPAGHRLSIGADNSLADIWYRSDAFNRFRGTDWMPEPCQKLRPRV